MLMYKFMVGRVGPTQLADRGSECPAVAGKDRARDFLILVLCHNGLVRHEPGARVGSAWRATGFGLRVRRCRQRDTHGYPPNTDLLLVMIFAGVFDVDGRLICSEVAGQRRRCKGADPDDRFN